MNDDVLLNIFKEKKYLSPIDVDLIVRFCKKWKISSYNGILDCHLYNEHQLAYKLAHYFEIEFCDSIEKITPNKLQLDEGINIEEAMAKRNLILADKESGQRIFIIVDPTQLISEINSAKGSGAYESISLSAGLKFIVTRSYFQTLLERYYPIEEVISNFEK